MKHTPYERWEKKSVVKVSNLKGLRQNRPVGVASSKTNPGQVSPVHKYSG